MHSELRGIIPLSSADTERAALQVDPDEIGYDRWSYVAMGEYHVHRKLHHNAYYSGAIEYTSFNIWGELQEEKEARLRGKGIVEYDLETKKKVFHSLEPAPAHRPPDRQRERRNCRGYRWGHQEQRRDLAGRHRRLHRQAGRHRHSAPCLARARSAGVARIQAACAVLSARPSPAGGASPDRIRRGGTQGVVDRHGS
jgi:hypothetical protein